jgi:hypothetical protein
MTEKQQQRYQELTDNFMQGFSKHRDALLRIIQNRAARPSDTELIVSMALYMHGELDRWEAQQIDKLPPP